MTSCRTWREESRPRSCGRGSLWRWLPSPPEEVLDSEESHPAAPQWATAGFCGGPWPWCEFKQYTGYLAPQFVNVCPIRAASSSSSPKSSPDVTNPSFVYSVCCERGSSFCNIPEWTVISWSPWIPAEHHVWVLTRIFDWIWYFLLKLTCFREEQDVCVQAVLLCGVHLSISAHVREECGTRTRELITPQQG